MEGRNGAVAFLVAESGHGKTTATHHLLREHLAEGGFGLWLEPDILQGTPTVEAAIEATLRGLRPRIEVGCGSIAIGLARQHGGLLLVADDVNRAQSPAGLVQKIAGWNRHRSLTEVGAEVSEGSEGYRVLCPVWPQVIGQITDQAEKTIRGLCIYAGPFSAEEGANALLQRARVAGVEITALQAGDLSERLGHDPLLISFWSEDSLGEGTIPVSARVIERFIQKRLVELSKFDPATGLAEEYEETLLTLANRLLEERVFDPSGACLMTWIGDRPGQLPQLRCLIDRKDLIRLEPSAQGRLAFRHDRVRDHLLAKAFHRRMAGDGIPTALLRDPYYAEVIGQALLLGGIDLSWASRIEHANPLALFYALRVFQQPATPMQEEILEALRRWIREEILADHCVGPLRWSVAQVMAETDSLNVLELTEGLPWPWPALWEARMRNGEVEAAARYSYWEGIHHQSPRMSLLIQHTRQKFGYRFVRDLAALLIRADLSEELRRGALYLAGHLGDQDLVPAIARCWEEGGSSSVDMLEAFLWAGLRCCRDPALLLAPMLEVWGALSDERREKHEPSDRSAVIAYGLVDGIARAGIKDPAVAYLLTRAREQDGALAGPLFAILRGLDHPDAIEFCLRDERGWDLSSYWEPRGLGRTAVVRSRDRLGRIWEEETEDPAARGRAFSLWSQRSNEDDLDTFRAIGPASSLYEQALRKRAELGDRSCAREIASKIESEEHPWTWWFYCERIWSEPIRQALERHFEQRSRQVEKAWNWTFPGEDSQTSRLLVRIPHLEAIEIMTHHWAHLRYSPHFVQTALYLGSSQTLALVSEAVRECPEPEKIFEFIRFGEFAQAPEGNEKSGLTSRRLESLAPYLHLFDEMAIDWFWQVCNRLGRFAWRRDHVDGLISEKLRRRAGLTDESLFAELNDFAKNKRSRGFLGHWLDWFQQRGDSERKAITIVASWLREQGTFAALEVAAECVAQGGAREDLALLETSGLSAEDPGVVTLLKAARFRVFRRSLS